MPRDLFIEAAGSRDLFDTNKTEPDKLADRTQALGSGANRGLLRLLGLAGDTAYNVRDLGKTALGAPFLAAGSTPPSFLEVGDRANDPLSGDWLISQAMKTKPGQYMLTAHNPAYEGGYIQNAGGALATAPLGAKSGLDMLNQALLGTTSSALAKYTFDKTGSPSAAIVSSFLPGVAQNVAVEGAKRAVRGGEEGRQAMVDRIATLKAAGVNNPTLGLASGNQKIAGLENILSNTPGAVGTMKAARDAAIEGMRGKVMSAADEASLNRGDLAAGRGIQEGLKQFRSDLNTKQGLLYDQLGEVMGPQFPTPVTNTRDALAALNSDIPGAPALSGFFKNSKLQALEGALKSDTSGSPASVMVYPQPAKGAGGLLNQPQPQDPVLVSIPQGPQRSTLPFQAVKQTRTMVGNEIADSNLLSDIPKSKWNPLYGALTEDIKAGAANSGPEATAAFNRANDYTRAGYGRLERVAPIADKPSPEQSFAALEGLLRQNVSTFDAVKKSLPEGARGQVAGTIVEQLGAATPGQQNAAGNAWSPETFLTNWNRMTPEGRKSLLSGFPNADQVARDVDAVAKSTEMMRASSKMWANPSGTAANLAARGTIGAVGTGGLLAATGVVPWSVPLIGGAGLLGSNLSARALTNQNVRDAIARQTTILDPKQAVKDYMVLNGGGLLGYQPE